MNDYAVVKVKDKQYIVSKGDEIVVPGTAEEKEEIRVLLIVQGQDVLIGKPYLEKKSPKFKVVAKNVKGKKIEVFKYKSKSRYRKKMGFRSVSTKLHISDLG